MYLIDNEKKSSSGDYEGITICLIAISLVTIGFFAKVWPVDATEA